jgi:hypothetical protein
MPLLVGDEVDTAADRINSNQMLAKAVIAHAVTLQWGGGNGIL